MRSKTTLRFVLTLGACFALSKLPAQNWQYVGSPYINQTAGSVTSLDFGDIERNAAGDIFVSYTEGSGSHIMHVAQYSGGTWTQLASPGSGVSGSLGGADLEVQGTNYYYSYGVTISSKSYVFVSKYNGTSWVRLGDSLQIGNASNYDLLIDNNGNPVVVGAIASSGSDKMVKQFNGSSWTTVCTIGQSSSASLNENVAVFDSQNNMYVVINGNYVFKSGNLDFYTIIHKITGGTVTTAGDTLFTKMSQTTNNRIKINSSDIPFLCARNSSPIKTLAYKLNGASWTIVGDTSVASVPLTSFDITSADQVVFCGTQTASPYKRRVYYFDGTTTTMMDTLNTTNSISSVPDILVAPGTSDVYQLVGEVKPGAFPDISVMKHSIVTGINENAGAITDFNVYPNPSKGMIYLRSNGASFNRDLTLDVINSLGEKIDCPKGKDAIDLSGKPMGMYFIRIHSTEGSQVIKVLIE